MINNFSLFILILVGIYLVIMFLHISHFLIIRFVNSKYCSKKIIWKSFELIGIRCRGAIFYYYNRIYSDHGIKFIYEKKIGRNEGCSEVKIVNLKNEEIIRKIKVQRKIFWWSEIADDVAEISFLYKIKKQDLFEIVNASHSTEKFFDNFYERDYFI